MCQALGLACSCCYATAPPVLKNKTLGAERGGEGEGVGVTEGNPSQSGLRESWWSRETTGHQHVTSFPKPVPQSPWGLLKVPAC